MKREIKFRAKRIDNGEWDYGYYVVHHIPLTDVNKDTNQIVRVGTKVVHTLFNDQRTDNNGYHKDINPDTLGQFTGLLDKNGKEIYEGDIVSFDDMPYCVSGEICRGQVVVHRGVWCVKHYNKCFDEYFYTPLFADDFASVKTVVIGNIYDNKEFLKGIEE